MAVQTVPFHVGDTIEVPEEHYRYGQGTLRLRVHGIHRQGPINGWLRVYGVPIDWRGRDGDPRYAEVELGHVRVVEHRPAPTPAP